MATHTAPLTDAAYTPQEAMLTDQVANEVYASHYAERKLSRFVIGALSVALLGSFATIVSLSNKPIQNHYVRIDEMGRAQAIQYSDLRYSPREGEVRTYLTDWASYRYTLNKETIAKKYPLNYYFLSQPLAAQYMAQDNNEHKISEVMTGQAEQSETDVRNVTITAMSEETVQGVTMARGTALINLDKLYSGRTSQAPRTEHWMVAVTYYINLNHSFMRSETASAIDFALYCERAADGKRRVRELIHVRGYDQASQTYDHDVIYSVPKTTHAA